MTTTIITEPGSNSTSEDVEQLNKWIGIQVGRHESNGVEGTNKQTNRHLRTLVSDERVMHQWSLPSVLRTVEYVLNDTINSETGTSALLLRFGSDVETYMKLPSQLPPADFTSKYVKLLDEKIKPYNGSRHLLDLLR
jgi:hypothetical protein